MAADEDENEPTEHGWQTKDEEAAEAVLKVPAGHATQVESLAADVAVENVPAGQASGEADCAGQKWPAVHGRGAEAP